MKSTLCTIWCKIHAGVACFRVLHSYFLLLNLYVLLQPTLLYVQRGKCSNLLLKGKVEEVLVYTIMYSTPLFTLYLSFTPLSFSLLLSNTMNLPTVTPLSLSLSLSLSLFIFSLVNVNSSIPTNFMLTIMFLIKWIQKLLIREYKLKTRQIC